MIYGCFAAAATGSIVRTGSQMNSARDQAILKESVLPSVRKLGLGRCWIFLQENDPEQIKPTKVWGLKTNF